MKSKKQKVRSKKFRSKRAKVKSPAFRLSTSGFGASGFSLFASCFSHRQSNLKPQTSNIPRGVTLLELAVSIAVGSMIFFIIGAIFIAQSQYFAIEDAIAETQVQAFQAADATGLYAASARRVVGSRTINGAAYSSGESLVILELPSINAAGAVLANTYDYVAIGRDPNAAALFIVDIERGAGSSRPNGKFVRASLVDKVIFRYNTVDITAATALDLYLRTSKNARGRTITMPLGKVYYLGSS